jgi:hypothetical protein
MKGGLHSSLWYCTKKYAYKDGTYHTSRSQIVSALALPDSCDVMELRVPAKASNFECEIENRVCVGSVGSA